MVCFLFKKGASVLRGKVAVLSAIIERCVNRESIRKTDTTPMKEVKQSLSNLGQLALHGLMADNFQESFRKVSQSGYRHLIWKPVILSWFRIEYKTIFYIQGGHHWSGWQGGVTPWFVNRNGVRSTRGRPCSTFLLSSPTFSRISCRKMGGHERQGML